jgi:hypothetical protein
MTKAKNTRRYSSPFQTLLIKIAVEALSFCLLLQLMLFDFFDQHGGRDTNLLRRRLRFPVMALQSIGQEIALHLLDIAQGARHCGRSSDAVIGLLRGAIG